jgi:Kef-type K+ transport system membrane component KefB
MSSFLQLITLLAIILVAAKTGGYLSSRLGQPAVLGELIAGVILGPVVLDILHWPIFTDHTLPEMVDHLAEFGVLLLMFVAGLELHLSELVHNTRVSALGGILGVLVPVSLGYGVGMVAGLSPQESFFLGLTLGATSVSISAQTLMELGKLRTRVGLGLLGAAVFDDILVIFLLSGFLALVTEGGGLGAIGLLFLRMALFLALSVAFGLWALPYLARKTGRLPISQGVLTLALVVLFVYGLAAELVGSMAAISGTFLAGLMFARSPEKERIEQGVHAMAYSFFVPIFFISIGLAIDPSGMNIGLLWFFLGITLVAVAGKFFGSGLGARLAKFSWRESAQLGAGMVSRGEVGLIIASVGISQGLVEQSEYSAIIGMVLVTTLITPLMLRALFAESAPAQKISLRERTQQEEVS